MKRVAEEVAHGLSQREYKRVSAPKVDRMIAQKLAHSLTVGDGLSDLLNRHAVYWHNRYLAKSRQKAPKAVVVQKQIAAKAMRQIKFKITADQKLVIDNVVMVSVLRDVYSAYMKKRLDKHKFKGPIVYPSYHEKGIVLYGRALDYEVVHVQGKKPTITFETVAYFLEKEIALFQGDFVQLIQKAVRNDPVQLPEDYGTAEYVEEPEYFREALEGKHSLENPGLYREPIPVQVDNAEPIPVVLAGADGGKGEVDATDNGRDYFADLAFETSTHVAVVRDQTVDLAGELAEAGIDMNHAITKLIMARYPRMVAYTKVDKIHKMILKAFGDSRRT
jgi:hypothetical protein